MANLRYISDNEPGFSRRLHGRHFRYFDIQGKPIRNFASIERLKKLAIPPAWQEVWICPDDDGHIQATGRDARGRKQYIYHPAFRAAREASKYHHLLIFAAALPNLRRQIHRDMRRPRLDRRKIISTVISLMETTLIRIGNNEYARTNSSYGITTLRNRHVTIEGSTLEFKFRGKSGKLWKISMNSRRAANIVRACQELPGQHLFQYEMDNGSLATVTSTDVNAYLREITGKDITAKDYRTWAGTVMAATRLHMLSIPHTGRKRALNEVIRDVAEALGNTPAICRKCYIHPAVQESFLAGTFSLRLRTRARKASDDTAALDDYERAVARFLAAAQISNPTLS